MWTGTAPRQPAFRAVPHRAPAGGLPNADRVMQQGLVLPNHHAMSDDDCHHIGECLAGFVADRGLA